ncbi:hypothetical protein CISIN_1g0381852mg, partial [Citrus sinensis]
CLEGNVQVMHCVIYIA